ncbi:MAG: SDR family NAD(P)-dependent oxidoreductase [Thermoplasmata archaeon]
MSGPSTVDRVALVTGATSGIGREVSRRLAALGWTTVVIGRGQDRASEVAARIAASTGNPRVEALSVADLALRSDVRSLVSSIHARYPRVHLLVNNAGAYFARREVSADGLERTFALNVLAPFALTVGLADRLRASAPSTVVQVTSAAHRGARVDLADLQSASRYRGYRQYGRSKLELLLLTRELARRFAGSGVTVNAVHPGFIRSAFGENTPGGARIGFRLAKFLFARSVGTGARNIVHVATDPAAAALTGEYYSGERRARASTASYDVEVARKLFEACQMLATAPDLVAAADGGRTGIPPPERSSGTA